MYTSTYNFFFSYSRNIASDILEKIIYELEQFGFLLWYDKVDVVIGNNINVGLYNVLKQCEHWNGMILFIDDTYLKKEWCIRELDYAIKNNIKLFPILFNIKKDDIPDKYEILKELNLCTICNERDIDYALSKIIYRYLDEYTIIKKEKAYIQNNPTLKQLAYEFSMKNHNCSNILFICDNIAVCINYLLSEENEFWDNNEKIIYNIVHLTVKKYYIQGNIDRFRKRIAIKAINILLSTYF